MPKDFNGNEIFGDYVKSDYSGIVAIRYATNDNIPCVLCGKQVPSTDKLSSPHV